MRNLPIQLYIPRPSCEAKGPANPIFGNAPRFRELPRFIVQRLGTINQELTHGFVNFHFNHLRQESLRQHSFLRLRRIQLDMARALESTSSQAHLPENTRPGRSRGYCRQKSGSLRTSREIYTSHISVDCSLCAAPRLDVARITLGNRHAGLHLCGRPKFVDRGKGVEG